MLMISRWPKGKSAVAVFLPMGEVVQTPKDSLKIAHEHFVDFREYTPYGCCKKTTENL